MSRPFIPATGWRQVEPGALKLPDSLAWCAYARELARSGPDGVPRRDALDLIRQRPKLAGLAILVRVLPDDYEFRLAGEEVLRRVGFPLKGVRLSDIDFNGVEGGIRAKYDRAVASRQPQCSVGFYVTEGGERRVHREAVVIPVADALGAVTHLLIGMAYGDVAFDPMRAEREESREMNLGG